MDKNQLTEAASSRLLQDSRGSAYVEYILLVGLFGLIVAGAVVALGEPLLHFYRHSQLVWAGPFP